jgi:hypothetical protein
LRVDAVVGERFCTAKSDEELRGEEEQATAKADFGEVRARRLEQGGDAKAVSVQQRAMRREVGRRAGLCNGRLLAPSLREMQIPSG